jgi:hypothetical protein
MPDKTSTQADQLAALLQAAATDNGAADSNDAHIDNLEALVVAVWGVMTTGQRVALVAARKVRHARWVRHGH